MSTRIIEGGFTELKQAGARSLSKLGQLLVRRAAGHAPVRRGYRSFDQSLGPQGGTLRDSISYAVAVEGRVVDNPTDRNGNPLSWIGEEMTGGRDVIELVVATNTGSALNRVSQTQKDYGVFVHEGTVKMASRPFLLEALQETNLDNFGGGES